METESAKPLDKNKTLFETKKRQMKIKILIE